MSCVIFVSHVCAARIRVRSEEHTSELQSHLNLVCRLLLEKKKNTAEVRIHMNLVCRDPLVREHNAIPGTERMEHSPHCDTMSACHSQDMYEQIRPIVKLQP